MAYIVGSFVDNYYKLYILTKNVNFNPTKRPKSDIIIV